MMRYLLSLVALLVASASWSQVGVSSTYPQGTPWSPGTLPILTENIHWDGSQESPPSWSMGGYPGDGRGGLPRQWGGFQDYAAYPPYARTERGGWDGHYSFVKTYEGADTGLLTAIFGVQIVESSYVYDHDVPIGPWKHPAKDFSPEDVFNVAGLPPGLYRIDVHASDGRGITNLYGQTDIWFCPKMYKCRVKVSFDGHDVGGVRVQPLTVHALFGGSGKPSWRPGVTNSDGYVDLLFPTNGKIAVEITLPEGQTGRPGMSVSPGSVGWLQAPYSGEVVDGMQAGPDGQNVVVYQVTVRPDAPPLLEIASADNGNDQAPGFWMGLWKPSPSKLEQFAQQKAYWSSWGPFGLGSQLSSMWFLGVIPDGEARLAGLLWPVNGPLGQAVIDLRPPINPPAAPYSDGGRGSLGGGLVAFFRVFAGLAVWALFLFGLYKKLRPMVKT